MEKFCLIILDMQRTLVFPSTKHFEHHSNVLYDAMKIQNLPNKIYNFVVMYKQKFDFVVFTKFVNSPDSSFVRYLDYQGRMAGTEIDLVDEMQKLIEQYGYPIFIKNTYSIFKIPELIDFLKKIKLPIFSLQAFVLKDVFWLVR